MRRLGNNLVACDNDYALRLQSAMSQTALVSAFSRHCFWECGVQNC